MARVTIKFITLHLEDDQVECFLKELEQILKGFSGTAYNFRYEVEGASSGITSKGPEKRT
jgi:hypothetical protein